MAATRGQLTQSRAAVEGTTSPTNPDVLAAEASCAQRHRSAPAICISSRRWTASIAQRTVQVGQQVARGHAADGGGAARRCLDRCQFQGSAACSDMRVGQPVTVTRRHLWRQRHLSRPCRRAGRRLGQRLRAAAAAECVRQLDQDRPARAGAHRARPAGTGDHPLRVGLSVDRQRRCAATPPAR